MLRVTVAELAVAIVAPAVEVAGLGESKDMGTAAICEADNILEKKSGLVFTIPFKKLSFQERDFNF
jgi:hypothetical protein